MSTTESTTHEGIAEPIAAETPRLDAHSVVLDVYDPDLSDLVDWKVYSEVINESADTVEQLIEEYL